MNAVSRASTDTEYSACAVEFCPTNPSLFVCGTYQIVKEDSIPEINSALDKVSLGTPEEGSEESDDDEVTLPSPVVTRFGRCLLYEIDEDGSNLYFLLFSSSTFVPPLTLCHRYVNSREVQRFDGPAILDLKW
jgi:diphthamide biosynthesis protein 7